MALELCYSKHRFLFEARPDLLPEGRLTDLEMELWSMFYLEKNREMKKHG